jgi:hypothetical protein
MSSFYILKRDIFSLHIVLSNPLNTLLQLYNSYSRV